MIVIANAALDLYYVVPATASPNRNMWDNPHTNAAMLEHLL